MSLSDFAAKVVGDKRRWREYRARVRALPENYRMAVDAYERYFMRFGASDAENAMRMFEDLVELFEQAAVDRTAIHAVVGDDPVAFAEEFRRNYGDWGDKERRRLATAIEQAEALGADAD